MIKYSDIFAVVFAVAAIGLVSCKTSETSENTKVQEASKEQVVKPSRLIKVSTPEELSAALDAPKPGDSIVLTAARYAMTERLYINDSGIDGQPIYLLANSSENRPVLDFSALEENSSHQGIVLKADHWDIQNIAITRAGDNGMQVRGSHNRVENCSFSYNRDTGLQLDDGASENRIINCDSYFNADSTNENADGFAVKMDVGSGNEFIGCRAWNNLDDGWDGYLREADDIRTLYKDCWAFNNGYDSQNKAGKGDGNGFKTGGSDDKDRKHNAQYFRCIAAGNLNDGFDHNSNRGTVEIINCAAFKNGRNLAFADKNNLEKLVLYNNLVFGDLGKAKADTVASKTNSWELSLPLDTIDWQSFDTSHLAAARKPDGSLPDLDFFQTWKRVLPPNSGTAYQHLKWDVQPTYIGPIKP